MKIGIVGHFGGNKKFVDGQTAKTKTIYSALSEKYTITKLDTFNWKKHILQMFKNTLSLIKKNDNVIIITAQKGLFVFIPMFVIYNIFFHKKLHYVVIGGWLKNKVAKNKIMIHFLKGLNGIYVENSRLKEDLISLGLNNVFVMKNFKIIKSVDKVKPLEQKIKLCFFARVMKEKGIEDAIKCVEELKENVIFDIYGPIDINYEDRFNALLKTLPENINYRGVIDFEKSTEILKEYDILLFPTKFKTEGIPGTIIDAYASGLAIVASKWDNYSEIMDDGITGIGFEINNYNDFKEKLIDLLNDENKIMLLKNNALKKFSNFSTEEIKVLESRL